MLSERIEALFQNGGAEKETQFIARREMSRVSVPVPFFCAHN